MTSFYPLYISQKSIWNLNQNDIYLIQKASTQNNDWYSRVKDFQNFQERVSWAIIKLTCKLYKVELSLYAAIFKWRTPCEDKLGRLLYGISKQQCEQINMLLTRSNPWYDMTQNEFLFTLRWVETILIVLRFNPIRVRFPDDKFCPCLYTLDLLRICVTFKQEKPSIQPQLHFLFENMRSGCQVLFDSQDFLFKDPLEYIISVNQEKYKEMIKWVSIADSMRTSFMQLLHFQSVKEDMLDKLYAWIYKICLYMFLQDIWTTEELQLNLDRLWVIKQDRSEYFMTVKQ